MAKRTHDPKAKLRPGALALLSAEEKASLQYEAEQSAVETMKQEASSAYFNAAVEEAKRAFVPDDQIVLCTIDCAPYVNRLLIDGVEYFHGFVYEVPLKLYRVLVEQMQRSWAHQDEIDGRSKMDAYRRPRELRIGPQDAGRSTFDPVASKGVAERLTGANI